VNVDRCVHCGGSTKIDPDYRGPHSGRYVCTSCGWFCGWARKPITIERAASWKMPFGQYRGCTLAEINACDRNYLWWLVENVDRASIQRVVCYFLDQTEAAAKR
jgi:Putative quorum-sensing-regulated virulence factor